MSDTNTAPKWFWVISLIALLWNLMGAAAYVSHVTMSPETLGSLPADQQALYAGMPVWANAAFAIAVWAGVAGCLALLVKKRLAISLLMLSLLGVVVQQIHSFLLSNTLEVLGPTGLIMPAMVLAIACYLLWLSIRAKNSGWLS